MTKAAIITGRNRPGCGKWTTGTHSEGGVRFALCDDCYRQMIEQQRKQLDQELRRAKDDQGNY